MWVSHFERVGAASVLGDAQVVVVYIARLAVDDDVLNHGTCVCTRGFVWGSSGVGGVRVRAY